MAEQLDMFGAPAPAPKPRAAKAETEDGASARAVRKEMREETKRRGTVCPHHGPGNVCQDCPERYATDHSGFVHRLDCNGRIPLRKCMRCKRLVTPGSWNWGDWYHCLSCVPHGTMSEMGAARSPTPYLTEKK